MDRTRHAVFRLAVWALMALAALAPIACQAPADSGASVNTFGASVVPPAAVFDTSASPPEAVPVSVTLLGRTSLSPQCEGLFLTHQLDHVTTVPGETVDQFEANGAGVAVNDLDNDGDLDIVLANHAGLNSVFWNEGGLQFQVERLPHGDSRAVHIVDVDGDGWQDIVFTRRTGAINFWRNQGDGHDPQDVQAADSPGLFTARFRQETLPGLSRPAYAMAWGDLDRDGDLDLVTGSYDASLLADQGNDFLLGPGAGVFYWQTEGGRFSGQRLAGGSQAMAIALFDVNNDGWQDIVVANDFAVPDYAWLRRGDGWFQTAFDTTSYSTMSLDVGDVDNDGNAELFSTDMKPYARDPETVAAWAPLMADMAEHDPADPQIMANVLQLQTGHVGFQDTARPRGIDASGWTWSAKFGDLDMDGWLDLYAVNGMAEADLFAHLPNHELTEANQAFQNLGDGYFRSAPEWNLGSTYGGRGMAMGDLDGDGDLDIVVNNLRGPAQLFENRLCGGQTLQVDLLWPGSGNTRALGAVATLHTDAGSLTRDVRAGSGYLSGDPARLHFGFLAGTRLQGLEITWPDARVSTVTGLEPGSIVTVRRGG